MKARWLGWAGVEIEVDGAVLVIDPLAEPAATFAALPDPPGDEVLPAVVPCSRPQEAVAGLVTHLHRDHTDAQALLAAVGPGGVVLRPPAGGGDTLEEAALAQAEAELTATGLSARAVAPWERIDALGPFEVTALPAADGLGDPQLSWAVEAGGVRAIHCGDTMFHGWWWRAALRAGPFDVAFLPINGAVTAFPHRKPASPLPAALTPEEAALAGELLGARAVVPIHYGGYAFEPFYRPVEDALERFVAAAADRPYAVAPLEVGEERSFAVPASSSSSASSITTP